MLLTINEAGSLYDVSFSLSGSDPTVDSPKPTVSTRSPTSYTRPESGSTDVTVTITGTKFKPGVTVYLYNGSTGNIYSSSTTVTSTTQLTAVFPISSSASTGTYTIIVELNSNYKSTDSVTFTIS